MPCTTPARAALPAGADLQTMDLANGLDLTGDLVQLRGHFRLSAGHVLKQAGHALQVVS